jgi:hypothetical protein
MSWWPIIAMMLICMGVWIVIAMRRRARFLIAGLIVIMSFFGVRGGRHHRPGTHLLDDTRNAAAFGVPER